MLQPEAAAHIWDALVAARAALRFVEGTREREFLKDLLLRSAVERQLEILGEALTRLRRDAPGEAARIPDVARIIGMRNVIAHDYGSVDPTIVWTAVVTRVPALVIALEGIRARAGLSEPPDIDDNGAGAL